MEQTETTRLKQNTRKNLVPHQHCAPANSCKDEKGYESSYDPQDVEDNISTDACYLKTSIFYSTEIITEPVICHPAN
jgi:hypothetical protein